jgi:GT2 family glycosyltransferase
MKLSIVIICWNDADYLANCLESIYAETKALDFEIIVTDNGSTDGSLDDVRQHFPEVRIVANGHNLGFGPGNNAGIRVAQGEYVLILNPDTFLRAHALEKWVAYADSHPGAGAFGCRTLNKDGSFQITAQPLPTLYRYFCSAICLRWPGRFFDSLQVDKYLGWDGSTDRKIGFQAACTLLIRGTLLKELEGFDERFHHQYEDADLCHRVWKSGYSVRFCPDAEVVHIGGANRGRYPLKVVLETERGKYKYFHKHHGDRAVTRIRWISLLALTLRYGANRMRGWLRGRATVAGELESYSALLKWNWQLDPVQFVTTGVEPDIGYAPLMASSQVSKPALAKK